MAAHSPALAAGKSFTLIILTCALSMGLSIIIVNFNSGELLAQCVESIRQHCGKLNVETVVIDNASHDASCAWIGSLDPGLILIKNHSNVGFPAACNQGIQIATGEVILLLNPDARVEPDTIPALLEGFETYSRLGICTVAQTDGEHRYIPCYPFPSVKGYLRSLILRQAHAAKLEPMPATGRHRWLRVKGYVSGACLTITRKTIDQIGLMDDTLFWIEDADWCKRASDQGIEIGYCDDVALFHRRSAIAKAHLDIALYYQYTSKPRYLRKHSRPGAAALLTIVITLEVLIKWLVTFMLSFRSSTAQQARARMRAYQAVLRQFWLSAPTQWESGTRAAAD